MNEEWRSVPGYDGLYEVSDRGRVRSLSRTVLVSNKYKTFEKKLSSKILNPTFDRDGYLKVSLCNAGVQKTERVHSLVALGFIGPRPPTMECMHLDGNKTNNLVSNIKYGSSYENNLAKIMHGTTLAGSKHHKAKLSELEIINITIDTRSNRVMGAVYGVSPTTISDIKLGKTWKHLP